MKIRHGFVSNSSSSSFLAIIPKADWETVMNGRSPLTKAVAEELISPAKFCGMDLIEFSYIAGQYDTFDDGGDCYESIAERAEELAKECGEPISEEDMQRDNFQALVYESRREITKALYDIEKLNSKVYTHTEEF